MNEVIDNAKSQAHQIVEVDINKDLEEYGTQSPVPIFDSIIFDYSLL